MLLTLSKSKSIPDNNYDNMYVVYRIKTQCCSSCLKVSQFLTIIMITCMLYTGLRHNAAHLVV